MERTPRIKVGFWCTHVNRAVVVGTIICAFFLWASSAAAASFQITPSIGSFSMGQRFAVTISVNSDGVPINAAEGTLEFDSRYLKVESVLTNISIFQFWAQQPAFSNAAGTVSFSGGLPSPGFSGTSGKMFTIVFLADTAGSSPLKFNSGAILANDGFGTNVLSSSQEGLYTVNITTVPPIIQPIQGEIDFPIKPVVTSQTHPEENTWYSGNSFRSSWKLPRDVDGVNYALFSNANYQLGRNSKGLTEGAEYNLSELGDRVWYFFTRFHNTAGWGPVTRYTVRVDRVQPDPFEVIRLDVDDPTNPQPIIAFDTTDETSGVDIYHISIDGGKSITVDSLTYALPLQNPGEHRVVVRAVDRAQNAQESSVTITVEPLEVPYITFYSETFNYPNAPLTVRGTAIPETVVIVTLEKSGERYTFSGAVNNEGIWEAILNEKVPSGMYELSVYVEDARKALSLPTDPVVVRAKGLKTYLIIIGVLVLIFLTTILPSARKNRKRHRVTEKQVKRYIYSLKRRLGPLAHKRDIVRALHKLEENILEELEKSKPKKRK